MNNYQKALGNLSQRRLQLQKELLDLSTSPLRKAWIEEELKQIATRITTLRGSFHGRI